MPREAVLHFAASETDSNLLYASGFAAGDPFPFFVIDGRRFLVASDLEIDRAKRTARADEVLSFSELQKRLKERGRESVDFIEATAEALRERGVDAVTTPADFPVEAADRLRGAGFRVGWRKNPFYPERVVKRPDEVEHCRASLQAAERATGRGIAMIRASEARGGDLWLDGAPLTSERVKAAINGSLLEDGCFCGTVIVAGGEQACDPHETGHGPLPAGRPIILDVFPRSLTSRYWGDMTRTVVKGRAAPEARKLFDVVMEALERALAAVRPGVKGEELQRATVEFFEKEGFPTRSREGRMEGFFHGLGHGVGLDIHEAPSLKIDKEGLKPGMVLAVEPALYYPGIGGVREEDLVVVREGGIENLSKLPHVFEM